MPGRPPVALPRALAALGAAGLAACSAGTSGAGAVRLEPVPSLRPGVAQVCRQVVEALPSDLAPEVERRVTSPPTTSTAAWGDPAVTLRCGTGPGSRRDDLYSFDGVLWAMHDTGASRTWTTVEAEVPVEVVVPDAYQDQAEMLGSLATALRPTLR